MAHQKTLEYVAIDRLLFDPENPRLPSDDEDLDLDSQDSILAYIQDAYSLRELGQSIVDNGYFAEEPLQVVPQDGSLRVVEGNRRLATLKLLTDPSARDRLPRRRRSTWEELAERATVSELQNVPVIVHAERDELLNFLGFRHISGVKRWRAEAKARYLTQLMREEDLDFGEAARRVGSQAPAVRRQAEAYTVLEQASEAELPVEGARRYFGLFYNALQDPGIRGYIGLPDPGEVKELSDDPIQADRLEGVHRVLRWLFGDEGRRAVITESRDISKLGRVLNDERATRALEESGDLEVALRIAGGDKESMETALREARLQLLSANGQAFEFIEDEEVVAQVRRIQEVLEQIRQTLNLVGASPR